MRIEFDTLNYVTGEVLLIECKEWEMRDNLVLKEEKVYISKDKTLRIETNSSPRKYLFLSTLLLFLPQCLRGKHLS